MSATTSLTQPDAEWSASDLEAAFAAPSFDPKLLNAYPDSTIEADWAVVGAVAAVLGLALAIVAYICGVCGARSFGSCYSAVISYWGQGC